MVTWKICEEELPPRWKRVIILTPYGSRFGYRKLFGYYWAIYPWTCLREAISPNDKWRYIEKKDQNTERK